MTEHSINYSVWGHIQIGRGYVRCLHCGRVGVVVFEDLEHRDRYFHKKPDEFLVFFEEHLECKKEDDSAPFGSVGS